MRRSHPSSGPLRLVPGSGRAVAHPVPEPKRDRSGRHHVVAGDPQRRQRQGPAEQGRGEDGELHPTTWEHAIETAAAGLKKVIAEHGPQSVGFLASARLTNEENYLIQKLARTALQTHSVHSCEAT